MDDKSVPSKKFFQFKKGFPPWDNMYAFFDVHDHPESPRILKQKNIRAKIVKTMTKKDSPYMIIVCRIPKKQSETFLEAINELERDLLLKGYSDYSDFCTKEVSSYLEYVSRQP